MRRAGSVRRLSAPDSYSDSKMATPYMELLELSQCLRKEKLFVESEKAQIQDLNKKVMKAVEDLYHLSWITRQQQINLEGLILSRAGITPAVCCRRDSHLQSAQFVDSYRQLGPIDPFYSELLQQLRSNPALVARLLLFGERSDPAQVTTLVDTIYSGVYGNCILQEDQLSVLQVLRQLMVTQVVCAEAPQRLLRRGSCVFSRVYKAFCEGLFAAKLFLTAALHQPVMQLLMDDEWFLDIDPNKVDEGLSAEERTARLGRPAVGGADGRARYHAAVADRLARLTERFVTHIADNAACFPPSLSWVVRTLYHLLVREDRCSADQVNAICVDLLFAFFICPAVVDPVQYGILEAPVSPAARHNLIQVGQILQVLAMNQWEEVDPRLRPFYDRFDKGSVSSLLGCILTGGPQEGPPAEQETRPAGPLQHESRLVGLSRSAVLITRDHLDPLVGLLRQMAAETSEPPDEAASQVSSSGPEPAGKRTRASLSHDGSIEAASNVSDSDDSSLEDAEQYKDDNLSDMVSANVSGRETPNVSGRNTPSSQVTDEADTLPSGGERPGGGRAAPHPPPAAKPPATVIEDKFGKFNIKPLNEGDETVSMVSDTWSTDVLASDTETVEQADAPLTSRQLLELCTGGVGLEPSETASEAWSTDVLASDSERDRLAEVDADDSASVARSDDTARSERPGARCLDEMSVLEDEVGGSEPALRPAAATGAIPKSISFDKTARRGFFKNLKLPFKSRRKGSRELVSDRLERGSGDGREVLGDRKGAESAETSDDILAKYRRKTPDAAAQTRSGATLVDGATEDEAAADLVRLTIDPNNVEASYAFSDAKRKLRRVLSAANVQTFPWRPQPGRDESGALLSFLRLQLSEYISLQDHALMAQLHETVRCVSLFDAAGQLALLRSLREDYSGRAPYIAYLVRCRDGLLDTLAHVQLTVRHVRRDQTVCTRALVDKCVLLFLERHKQTVHRFQASFQQAAASDEKTDLVARFLAHLGDELLRDPDWQAADDHQLHLAREAIEQMVMAQIYTLALYPNGEADVSRDQVLTGHMRRLALVVTPGHPDLKIPSVYHYEHPWPSAQAEITALNAYKTARDKVACVTRCCATIMNLLHIANERSVPAADDLIPVLVFVLIKACPSSLLSTIQYVNSFYGDRLVGEDQYWWTQFCSAAEFIKTMDY
ncbi:GTPase-activating protein and VPS9 domain-containing protein 1-like [Pollicipes pollicipes]|uniref:GTPase-activating protein and VPS9 domain-containing protein 1-like n=1 Tax=Pollicipes pollicipes TaxID=41117 RepID=UPI001885379B|nr:GTPase-activating protein and VPS9 domain-containing protein 1-like [Pollicipes pollicipes]